MATSTLTPLQAARAAWKTETGSIKPCARTVRPALKAAGLEQYIDRVSTGKRRTYIWIKLVDVERDPSIAHRMADALSPLWADGDTRVRYTSYSVQIDGDGYYKPEAIATGDGRQVERVAYDLGDERAEDLSILLWRASMLVTPRGGYVVLRERALDHLRALDEHADGHIDADGVMWIGGTGYSPLED